jgi:hypothetical protein
MIKTWVLILLAFSLFSPLESKVFATSYCGGGDGPHPFNDVSSEFSAKLTTVPTVGMVQEMVYWEKRQSFVYRNESDDVYLAAERQKDNTLVTHSPIPLSPVIDPGETFVLGAGSGNILDLSLPHPQWFPFVSTSTPLEHLFWHEGYAYSMATENSQGSDIYHLYRYKPGSGGAYHYCTVPQLPYGDFRRGEGHAYPETYFYHTNQTAHGIHLDVYLLNVSRCNWEPYRIEFEHPFLAPIQQVYRFDPIDAYAVKVEGNTRNLMWMYNGSCEYFTIDNVAPSILNPKFPTIATWSLSGGLSLISLTHKNIAHIFEKLPIVDLKRDNVRLSGDGRRLVLAPEIRGWTPQAIFDLELENRQLWFH